MSTFYVEDWGRSPEADRDVLGSLIDAAGGKPLPGRWGLAQGILAALSQPQRGVHPALHWPKVGLNVAGVVRAWRKANDPAAAETYVDPFTAWFRAKGLSIPTGADRLAGLVLRYSSGLPYEDVTPGASADTDWIRTFRLPNGGPAYSLHMWKGDMGEVGRGPYVERHRHDEFMDTVGELVWAGEGHSDLQLTAQSQSYGPAVFTLSNIGEPDDYVSGDDAVASLAAVSQRCERFRAKGVSRNILFYGPPGTGKTTLARSIARQLGQGRTLRVEADAMKAAGVGATLGFLRVLQPRVVLFDDMDRCMEHIIDLLHTFERNGVAKRMDALLIGTINVIERVDPALLRPGRFDEVIEIAEPSDVTRERIVDHYLARFEVSVSVRDRILAETAGFAPADLREIVQCVAAVGEAHLDAEIERVRRQRGLYSGDACQNFARALTRPATVAAGSIR